MKINGRTPRLLETVYLHLQQKRRREALSASVRLDAHIVSVGNITTGGTGKTPAVQWLVRRLLEAGIPTAVVARGYGGHSPGGIVSDGISQFMNADQAGDEAVLHAVALPGVPVVIGRDRVAACRTAIQATGVRMLVLDDGFQYWSLHRDFDLVLVDAAMPLGNGKMLPLGRLRESPDSLSRADAILITRLAAAGKQRVNATGELLKRFSDAPQFGSDHVPRRVRQVWDSSTKDVKLLVGMPVCTMSAIADNKGFQRTVADCGAAIRCTISRRDHHRWTSAELAVAYGKARDSGADAIVTTDKDAVKLTPLLPAADRIYSSHRRPCLFSVNVELCVQEERSLLSLILGRTALASVVPQS